MYVKGLGSGRGVGELVLTSKEVVKQIGFFLADMTQFRRKKAKTYMNAIPKAWERSQEMRKRGKVQ